MGLFGFFKKKESVYDDFFGKLISVHSKETDGYFEAKMPFNEGQEPIDVLVHACLSGPTDQHREFYETFRYNYNQYANKLIPLIENEWREWKPDFKIIDFHKEFTLVFMEIPNPDFSPAKWDIAFNTVHDLNHTITISFTDHEPTGIHIDG